MLDRFCVLFIYFFNEGDKNNLIFLRLKFKMNNFTCFVLQYLKNESTTNQNIASLKQQPYHYASHYSNSGTVLHFLLRLPPYTQIFLQYQVNYSSIP